LKGLEVGKNEVKTSLKEPPNQSYSMSKSRLEVLLKRNNKKTLKNKNHTTLFTILKLKLGHVFSL